VAAGTVGTSSLVTAKRTITNTVNVASGQVLVIGGLTSEDSNEGKSQIPLLGNIPVVGELFKSRNVSRTKRNLMVFIHPTVLRTQDEGDFYTRRKYDALRMTQVQKAEQGKLPLGTGNRLVLPELDAYIRENAAPRPAMPPPPPAAPAGPPPATYAPPPAASATPAPQPVAPAASAEPAAPATAPVDRSTLPKNVFVIPAQKPGEPAPAR
jgi:general secretion pathway protein D